MSCKTANLKGFDYNVSLQRVRRRTFFEIKSQCVSFLEEIAETSMIPEVAIAFLVKYVHFALIRGPRPLNCLRSSFAQVWSCAINA